LPHETFRGPRLAPLMRRAEQALGPGAVVLAVRRRVAGRGAEFELVAADVAGAAALARARLAPASRPVWDDGPLRLALVGPTGSGKTTTLAKLAGHPGAFGRRAPGFLGLDTFRAGGVDQLLGFAEALGCPAAVAHEPDDVPRALRRLAGCDVVLVDTAGRGPRAHDDLEAGAALLARVAPHEVHVVVPAGLDAAHARRIVAAHAARGATHVLPTKLDEFPADPVVRGLALEQALGMRWIADGQAVPGALRVAGSPAPVAEAV
jgi:flagellar biosynthesis protein FlhF